MQQLQPSSPLLSLPGELRDVIYHHLFLSGYVTKALFPTTSASNGLLATTKNTSLGGLPVAYCNAFMPVKVRYRLPLEYENTHSIDLPWQYTDPTWLLACRTIHHEGMAHLCRNAEWLFDLDEPALPLLDYSPWLLTLANPTLRTINLEIRIMAEDISANDLERLRSLSDAIRQSGIVYEKVRIVALTTQYLNYMPDWIHNWGSSKGGAVFDKLAKAMHGLDVRQWQLGAESYHSSRMSWTLYEWTGTLDVEKSNSRTYQSHMLWID